MFIQKAVVEIVIKRKVIKKAKGTKRKKKRTTI